MKNAEEMFKELGYQKVKSTETEIVLEYKNTRYLSDNINLSYDCFIEFDKTYCVVTIYSLPKFMRPISMLELKAINQQCKELGWLE